MDSKARFSNRVENYIKFRPGYPDAVTAFLRSENLLDSESVVADIGSGTGISAELFLRNGNTVYGIEPNKEMREAAERLLKPYERFNSIAASAEETTLPDHSVGLVMAGQAFHWFDRARCKAEFRRILKPGGTIVLMWNDRRTGSTPFLQAYEECIRMFATDYSQVDHKNITAQTFDDFYGKGKYAMRAFDNAQLLDFEGLKGRLLSSSYIPSEGHPDYDFMISVLKKIFNRYAENGTVSIDYDTTVYYGKSEV